MKAGRLTSPIDNVEKVKKYFSSNHASKLNKQISKQDNGEVNMFRTVFVKSELIMSYYSNFSDFYIFLLLFTIYWLANDI